MNSTTHFHAATTSTSAPEPKALTDRCPTMEDARTALLVAVGQWVGIHRYRKVTDCTPWDSAVFTVTAHDSRNGEDRTWTAWSCTSQIRCAVGTGLAVTEEGFGDLPEEPNSKGLRCACGADDFVTNAPLYGHHTLTRCWADDADDRVEVPEPGDLDATLDAITELLVPDPWGQAAAADEPQDEEPTDPREWVEAHQAMGHEARTTVIAAPGYGTGSYCWTCKKHGPSTGGILGLGDVR